MRHEIRVLIADRNINVLNLLKRELTATGFQVTTTGDYNRLNEIINKPEKPDIFVVDPLLPGFSLPRFMRIMQEYQSRVPVIVHALLSDEFDNFNDDGRLIYLLKNGESTENLKKIITDLFLEKE